MSIRSNASTQGLAIDGRSLNALKLQAGQDSPGAIKEAAKQFESLFMRELIKSMREATTRSGMLDSAASQMSQDMLDEQYAVQLSGQRGGLGELIAKQLTRQTGGSTDPVETTAFPRATLPVSALERAANLAAYTQPETSHRTGQKNFVQRHSEAAANAAKTSGLPASYMLGQAGHETGWGKHEIKNKDGTPSYNLFGIKAGSNWNGKVAEVTTTEYVNGVAKTTKAKFRAYESYEESFNDYARLITQSPRYAKASTHTDSAQAFAAGLQKAGYATDPRYAAKLSQAILTTQRLQNQQA